MNRRTVLAGVGTALGLSASGCLGEATDATDASDPEMTLSLGSMDDDIDPLSFEIESLEEGLSETDVPTLEIAVENVGDEPATWTQSQSEFAFPQRRVTDELEIGLADEVDAALLDEEGCARLERRIARNDVEVETVLEPGDAIKQRCAVAPVDEELTDSCPDRGTYRTAHEYDEHGTWGVRARVTVTGAGVLWIAVDSATQPAFSAPIRPKRCVTITSPDPEMIATNETQTTPGSPPPRFFEIHVVSSIVPGSIAPLQTMSTVSIFGQKVFIPACYFVKRPEEYCL
ncbi:hypothetical protein C491_20162 [Natronococcus amylolyticus DSM 10524]|uniref:Uncharacterized protein n=1 Tax=Natronococcus amylolyticus DSM 10524 TaxID=1227497 RepID=L9WXK6_9EURY|nr:hypothetical protein [Natronococcus amylolyticus]ELY54142.1 hypothetical protein C491_20162 [Natronococcus amylolyticus DSM 10524]